MQGDKAIFMSRSKEDILRVVLVAEKRESINGENMERVANCYTIVLHACMMFLEGDFSVGTEEG